MPSVEDLGMNLVADRDTQDLTEAYFHEVFIHDSHRKGSVFSPGVYRHLLCIDRS
jgi:hypothetical protein